MLGNPDAEVLNGDVGLVTFMADAYLDFVVMRRVLDRVREQVDDDLLDAVFVGDEVSDSSVSSK